MSKFTDLLSDFESEKRFLALLEPYDPAAGAVVPVYLSSHGFVSAGGDAPANSYFDARLRSAFKFTRALFQQGRLSGRSVPGQGSIELVNEDGGLDHLATLAWGGRRIRVWMGGPGFTLTEYGLIFDGTAQGLAYGDGSITVNLRDLQYVFDREFQPLTFAGTGGVEGGDDVKDRRRPRPFGICRAVPPVFLGPDTGRNIFAVSDGPIVGVLRVLDRSVPLVQVASAPAPGEWSIDLATGILTLGGAYDGPLAVDVIGWRYLSVASTTSLSLGTGSRAFTVASVAGFCAGMRVRARSSAAPALDHMDGIVTGAVGTTLTVLMDASSGTGSKSDWTICPWGTAAGLASAFASQMGVASIDAVSVTALDLYQPAAVGIWRGEGGNGAELLDSLLDGAGCYWGFDRAGAFELGRLDVPGAPGLHLDETQVLSIERQVTDEPNHEVTVRYGRAWLVHSDDQIAGGASDADRAFLIKEWRQSKVDDADTLTAWPLSKPIEVESVFDQGVDAMAEAARTLTIFGARYDYFKVTVKMQPLALEIGDTVLIRHGRYGLSGGKRLRVVDVTEDMDAFEVELGLWG